jgi:hypothetical protein
MANPPAKQSRLTTRSILIAVAVVLGIALWTWLLSAEQRAIRGLPRDERIALYQRTLENVRTICANTDPALGPYCTEQARILLLFAECDAECRELAGRQVGR